MVGAVHYNMLSVVRVEVLKKLIGTAQRAGKVCTDLYAIGNGIFFRMIECVKTDDGRHFSRGDAQKRGNGIDIMPADAALFTLGKVQERHNR